MKGGLYFTETRWPLNNINAMLIEKYLWKLNYCGLCYINNPFSLDYMATLIFFLTEFFCFQKTQDEQL